VVGDEEAAVEEAAEVGSLDINRKSLFLFQVKNKPLLKNRGLFFHYEKVVPIPLSIKLIF